MKSFDWNRVSFAPPGDWRPPTFDLDGVRVAIYFGRRKATADFRRSAPVRWSLDSAEMFTAVVKASPLRAETHTTGARSSWAVSSTPTGFDVRRAGALVARVRRGRILEAGDALPVDAAVALVHIVLGFDREFTMPQNLLAMYGLLGQLPEGLGRRDTRRSEGERLRRPPAP